MNENKVENAEINEGTAKKRGFRFRMAVLLPLAVVLLTVSALAEGESSTGFNAVMSQWSNLTTLMGNVWSLMTGNEYFALFLALALLSAGISVFRRVKNASRH